MANFVVSSRLSFARNIILVESNQLRSSPLLVAAERQAVKKRSFFIIYPQKYPSQTAIQPF